MLDEMSGQLWAVVFFVVLIVVFRRQHAFISLLKYRLRLVQPERVARETLPGEVAVLLDAARAELEAAGFRHEYTEAAAPLNLCDPRPLVYKDIYWHPEHATLAQARLAEPYTGQAVAVDLYTAFADGTTLETINRSLWAVMAPQLEGYVFEDPCADTFAAQWQHHLQAQAREAARRGPAQGLAAAEAGVAGVVQRVFSRLQAQGWMVQEGTGRYRLTLKGAWLYARRQLRELRRVRAALKRPYQHGYTPDLEALRSNEMAAFATSIELAAQPLPQWMKAAMFALTLAASLLLFGRDLSLAFAGALLLVVLVHELGHLLAMRAYGFRNLSIIFLPFFGALATGHKTHVKPWQETVILLAGPVPGLVAALLLSQLPLGGLPPAAADFLRLVFWLALLVNLFNLLPVGILDGGKLFKLAVLSRFPYVGAFFWAGGTLVALVYALANGMLVLALAMGLLLSGVRNQFRAAHAVAAIRAAARAEGQGALDKEAAAARLGRHLARPEFNEASLQGWARRNTVAALAYPRLLQGVPGLATSAGVLAVHAAAFLAPLLIAAWLVQQPVKPPLLRTVPYAQTEAGKAAQEKWKREAAAAREKFLAQYAATRDPQQKWDMLENAADPDEASFALDRKWLDQQHEALLPLLPADHPARLWLLLEGGDKGGPRAQAVLLQVIATLGHGDARKIAALDDARFAVLYSAWRSLARHAPARLAAVQDDVLEATWKLQQQPASSDPAVSGPSKWRQAMLAGAGAHLAFAAGRTARAEAWMARRAVSNSGLTEATEQAWFRIDAGHPEQALARAQDALRNARISRGYSRDEWLSVAGWAEMARHNPRAADAWFVQGLQPRPQDTRQDRGPFNVGAWLLGLIQGRPAAPPPRAEITAPMLDHLAALEAYDAQEAARYRASLAHLLTDKWKKSIPAALLVHNAGADEWDRLRSDVLAKMLGLPLDESRLE